ncbi:flagellar protein FliT [Thioalkalivibrio sp. XN8]|uniref:flagellar protein FliT n=1 Tax=Thioalkalivibrio sp. XN8 TaxID=2712863 RepID=UPI0013EA8898|nr:flagellar protein FliT [Thioalkalivibrio sp. XN8]NGP52059.1 flagellar protein FliT [Thioalkalivibrio sp. XN8]
MMAAPQPRPQDSAIEELLEAAYALEAAAAADSWDEALELETLCRRLLEALLVEPPDLAQAESIETVAIIYRRVMGLAEECRTAVADELGRLRQGRRASNAYDAERGA